jgi:GH24 family phage-related lysozyme (muramidase)
VEAIDTFISDLKNWEGVYAWLYLDVRAYPTTGIGHLVATPSAMLPLPWKVQQEGKPATWRDATAVEKTNAWHRVSGMPKALRATAYASSTNLRLMLEDIEGLCRARLEYEFLPRLPMILTGWAQYPLSAQRALVDMAYNLGMGGLSRFVRMRAACAKWDWAQAAAESVRTSCRQARNDWTAALLKEAGDTPHPLLAKSGA